ncbi:hypothetical protein DN745_10560 [Bradymonas sediminis]|uniref:histidine kinase n=1 Tax=Bradymonas sediminis TaxID=1548548 RepID=A0A2Z4FLR7_9DELT|nr:hypothetical protein DN745_10560 [Bradymonas sediminis]
MLAHIEKTGCSWTRSAVRPEMLAQVLKVQTEPAIVLIQAEGDIHAICELLTSLLPQTASCPLPPYILVMGVGDEVDGVMRLYASGADEVLPTVLREPILHSRTEATARRLRRAQEVQRIRVRLEQGQERANVGSWYWNALTLETWWSPQIYELLDLDPSAGTLSFPEVLSHLHPDDRVAFEKAVELSVETKQPYALEFRVLLEGGGTRRIYCEGRPTYDEQGQLLEYEGVMQDIEARWQTESKLRRQEIVLGYISEQLPAALYQIRQFPDNSVALEYVTVGSVKGFEKLAEYKGDDITQYTYEIIEEDRPRLLRSTMRAAAELKMWVDEFRVIDDNGEIRWIAGQSTPEKCEDGSILWRGVLIDITERKLLNDQVQQADRLSTIGTMAAGIAHEINNPLVYLLGNVQFVLESLESEVFDGDTIEAADIVSIVGTEIQEMRRALTAAYSGAQRISVIVEDLMTFGRSSPVTDEAVDLRKICRSAARMLDSQIRHRATLFCEFEDIPEFDSNGGQLRQVLVNLLLNAAQAMPEDSVDKNKIYLRIAERDGYVIIEVEDNGPGILARDKRRLFEPFFTTKSRSDGTGLGLYVCRNIIKSMGGKIEVETTVGEGSTFRVILAIN